MKHGPDTKLMALLSLANYEIQTCAEHGFSFALRIKSHQDWCNNEHNLAKNNSIYNKLKNREHTHTHTSPRSVMKQCNHVGNHKLPLVVMFLFQDTFKFTKGYAKHHLP